MCTALLMYPDVGRCRAEPTAVPRPDALRPPRYLCRRLFQDGNAGRPGPSALLKSLEAELERQSAERWNFDFRKGLPLAGRYDWVSVCRPTADSSAAVAESPRTENAIAEVVVPPRRPAGRSPAKKTTQQSKITDFLKQKRKRDPSESADLCSSARFRRKVSDSAAAVHCRQGLNHAC